jgi:toxin secretion/phage lysis holin
MNTLIEMGKACLAAIGGYIAWFLGGFDGVLIALCVFAVVDYMTGVVAAIVEKKLCSRVGFQGIAKKFLMFLMVGIAAVLDMYVIGGQSPIREIVIVFYIANEGISIIENSARLGLPVPKKLIDVLEQLKTQGDGEV